MYGHSICRICARSHSSGAGKSGIGTVAKRLLVTVAPERSVQKSAGKNGLMINTRNLDAMIWLWKGRPYGLASKRRVAAADYIALCVRRLVNLFIHQDYTYSGMAGQVEIRDNQAIYFNPGMSTCQHRWNACAAARALLRNRRL